MKRGYIYNVRDYDNNPHKIVLMEDYDGVSNRIKAVANGNLYKFQWECLCSGRSTSIILHGFEKIAINIIPKRIGKVTEEGLRWIERHVEKYIMCDIDIKTDSQS